MIFVTHINLLCAFINSTRLNVPSFFRGRPTWTHDSLNYGPIWFNSSVMNIDDDPFEMHWSTHFTAALNFISVQFIYAKRFNFLSVHWMHCCALFWSFLYFIHHSCKKFGSILIKYPSLTDNIIKWIIHYILMAHLTGVIYLKHFFGTSQWIVYFKNEYLLQILKARIYQKAIIA